MPKEEQAQARLQRLAEEWRRPLTAEAATSLLSFGQLLLQWNERINLTGAKSLEELIDAHFPDAFALAAEIGEAEATVVDVGSGGGLPAVPLALLAPGISVLLVEPIRKKVAFLRTAIRACNLGNRASVVAERWVPGTLPGDRTTAFDVALSRATFHPQDWIDGAWSLIKSGGRVLALASQPSLVGSDRLSKKKEKSYAGGSRWLLSFVRST